MYSISSPLIVNTSPVAILNFSYQFVLSSRHRPGINIRDFHSIFPPSLPPSYLASPWWHFSKTLMWHSLYHVFIYIYSLPIEKDICDRQNGSIKLPCVSVCLLFGILFIFSVEFPLYFPISCVVHSIDLFLISLSDLLF